MARPDNGEATMVETGDSDRWSRSHTTITVASVVAQRQALVGEDELGGTPVVLPGELKGHKGPGGQRGHELRFDS